MTSAGTVIPTARRFSIAWLHGSPPKPQSGSLAGAWELGDRAGTYLASYPVSLAAGQWVQPAQPFLNVAGQTAMNSGYARITVQTGSGVFAFASVIDNITNDPTTISMVQEP